MEIHIKLRVNNSKNCVKAIYWAVFINEKKVNLRGILVFQVKMCLSYLGYQAKTTIYF